MSDPSLAVNDYSMILEMYLCRPIFEGVACMP